MASSRDLRAKIRSITNTKKITRTMELVATSKAKRAQNRVVATTPYATRIQELLRSLTRAGSIHHPLLERREPVERTAALVVTGKRGLCGGYNSSVLGLFERVHAEATRAGRDVDIYMVGRKGLQRLRFLKLTPKQSYTHFDDRPTFEDASAIAGELTRSFLAGEVQRVVVFSTRFFSVGSQKPAATRLLPIEPPAAEDTEKADRAVEFIFEPDPETMLQAMLPLTVRNLVYRLLVEAAASEQIARRMAMKRATDNAEEMIRTYTGRYNRTRQAGITQQINEIVSGASALQ